MNRFKILKEEDPFKDTPRGDLCKYSVSGVVYPGWRIDVPNEPTSIILKVPTNFLKFAAVLKNFRIEIENDKRIEIFEGEYVKNSPYNTKDRAHFRGTVSTPF